jgi:hypothetical protein
MHGVRGYLPVLTRFQTHKKELVYTTTRLRQKHHLNYDKVAMSLKRGKGIERVKSRKRIVRRHSREEEQRLIQQDYKER